MIWIDTHCHLDAPEFAADRAQERERARALGVACCVIPAVAQRTWDDARQDAHRFGDAYALGIHPLYTPESQADDLQLLDAMLSANHSDVRLVAVGEIGLDYFVNLDPVWQERVFHEQLLLAKTQRLPVILHVRKSVDRVLKYLRQTHFTHGGIAHAFNGSVQQAHAFLDMGFKLGFGGAMTYERARQLRQLASTLPCDAIVMETDSPDIPPHWLYVDAEARAQGQPQGRNSPAELPRIATHIAELRGVELEAWAAQTTRNALAALPKLAQLLPNVDADAKAHPISAQALNERL
ncbi:TatD family deoxyribonuclease [Lampropedia puyangensis]|uniref:TatD family deoxyribonuclease n=2 Tax=Lampropedia puyangensis TaxID=1330072 RepID=A0A4S8F733_9BURK|nr:TatD family deoxyribonuclease [Lampropedia puyangensis]